MYLNLVSVYIFVYISTQLYASALCPCEDITHCQPIDYNGKEIYAFVEKANRTVWTQFDWTKLTTIALVGFYDPELLCMAHKNKVRVVALGIYPKEDLLNQTKIDQWIKDQIQYAKDRYLDGINIDVEYDIAKGSPYVNALTSFTAQVRDKFHSVMPKSQVTFDIPWSPYNEKGTGIDGRNYDFIGLANATDFLFIMAYDEQSQIFDTDCTARANSNLFSTAGGIMAYMDLGIAVDKLVLGLPWYGYTYDCIKTGAEQTCYISKVPFRGVDCSDAAGRQLPYVEIMKLADTYGDQIDVHSETHFIYYTDKTNVTRQVWYDQSDSLSLKISFAIYKNLRGVGMWNANMLDYSGSAKSKDMVADMWGTFPDYKKIDRYFINY